MLLWDSFVVAAVWNVLSLTTNEASFCFVYCADKSQATLSLGMDLNLDWMSLDDFQKHLNGDDEILSGPPLSPSEYFH